MCIVYVDNLIFWCCDVTNIDRVAMELCKLEQEDDAAGFLGVKTEKDSNTGLLEIKQPGLIKIVVRLWVWMMDMLVVSIHQPKPSLLSRIKMV